MVSVVIGTAYVTALRADHSAGATPFALFTADHWPPCCTGCMPLFVTTGNDACRFSRFWQPRRSQSG
jgi:hypothetical protein